MPEKDPSHLLAVLDRATPNEWLAVVRYCALDLSNNAPDTLALIVGREAERRATRAESGRPADMLAGVLKDVGLSLSHKDDTSGEDFD